VAAAPIAALVAEADVAETVVDAAIVADMRAPVTTVKPVAVMPEAPVAGGPQGALVGSLNPHAGHPVVSLRRIGPVAGRPQIVVAGGLRLFVVGQRGRRLGSVGHWLLAVTGIVRGLVIGGALIGRRSALLVIGSRWSRGVVGG
jgi:hypothetical protein